MAPPPALGVLVVTPARNEADNLPELVASVRNQTRAPDRWVIVDDSSIDGTFDLARELCADLPFVEVHRIDGDTDRNFAAKVGAVHFGVDTGLDDSMGVIVNLDADATLPPDYLERVETAFAQTPRLGVFGGIVTWLGPDGPVPLDGPRHHVPGPAQAIRVATWNEVGGYWPLRYGGEDVAIYIAASRHGWTSRSDPTLVTRLRRRTGGGDGQGTTRSMYERGLQDHDLGRSVWSQLVKAGLTLSTPPIPLPAFARLWGYARARATMPRTVDDAFVSLLRERERQRARDIARRSLRRIQGSAPTETL